jgi:NADH-quinone oxidoreductase subunit C
VNDAAEPGNTSDVSREVVAAAGMREFELIDVREGAFGVHGTGDTTGFGGITRPVVMPGAATPPFGPSSGSGGTGWFDEVYDTLPGDAIEKVVIDRGEITFFVRRDALVDIAKQLRDDDKLRFEFCSSVSGVHYPHDTGRELHVAYHLLSMSYRRRIRLEVTTPDDDRHIPSVVPVYPTADWQERETWDFFGVIFDGHPALTRILMPDDWIGHPQRKDYPLGGIPVEYKGGTIPPPNQRRNYS